MLDDGHFYEDLTLQKMTGLIARMYSTWDKHSYHAYLNKFELPEDKQIKHLSRGMRMKYALVLALSHGAELFILDEPTADLDPLVRIELNIFAIVQPILSLTGYCLLRCFYPLSF